LIVDGVGDDELSDIGAALAAKNAFDIAYSPNFVQGLSSLRRPSRQPEYEISFSRLPFIA
jgi:hypothetical protein